MLVNHYCSILVSTQVNASTTTENAGNDAKNCNDDRNDNECPNPPCQGINSNTGLTIEISSVHAT